MTGVQTCALPICFPVTIQIKERSIYWNDSILHECFAKVRDDENFWLSIEPTIKELPFEPHCYITSRSINKEITQKWLDIDEVLADFVGALMKRFPEQIKERSSQGIW